MIQYHRDLQFFRNKFDVLDESAATLEPCTDTILQSLTSICTSRSQIWRTKTSIICFEIVEMHDPRALRWIGFSQYIFDPVSRLAHTNRNQKRRCDLRQEHNAYISHWDDQVNQIQNQKYPYALLAEIYVGIGGSLVVELFSVLIHLPLCRMSKNH